MKAPSFRRTIAAALIATSALAPLSASAMSTSLGRLANVSVYDRTEGRTLPVHWHNGQAWVVGSPGNEYQVNVRNPAGSDVLTVVSVDGVNVITGETAAPSQTGYIVDPWRLIDIKGWRKDTSRTAAFYFTSLADAYASRTGRPDNVGVIGVAVFRRKMPPIVISPIPRAAEPRPQSSRNDAQGERALSAPAPAAPESIAPLAPLTPPATAQSLPRAHGSVSDSTIADKAKRDRSQTQSSRLGTGHGRSEYSQITMVDFERATREPEEVLTIRYDSYANLVARGVIVARAPERWPNPFPNSPQGFVPDPPRY